MKALVTGASGFLGSHLVDGLLAAGHDVRALVLPEDVLTQLDGARVEIVQGDVARPETLAGAACGCDVVYNVAGLVPAPGLTHSDYARVNLDGTANVVRAAVDSGVEHVVQVSSVSVYGVPRACPANESTPTSPQNAYQATKLAAEHAVARLTEGSRTSATICRLTPVYGPRDLRTLGLFRDAARRGIVMVGRGEQPYHLSYVDDVIAALLACGARRPSGSDVFVIGGDEHVTVRGLLDTISSEVGGKGVAVRLPAAPFALALFLHRLLPGHATRPPGRMDRLDFFLAERTYDVSHARRELGLPPSTTLREGVRRTARWYRDHGHL